MSRRGACARRRRRESLCGVSKAVETPSIAVWMMSVAAYEDFYRALFERGMRLVNDPTAYRTAHVLPRRNS